MLTRYSVQKVKPIIGSGERNPPDQLEQEEPYGVRSSVPGGRYDGKRKCSEFMEKTSSCYCRAEWTI